MLSLNIYGTRNERMPKEWCAVRSKFAINISSKTVNCHRSPHHQPSYTHIHTLVLFGIVSRQTNTQSKRKWFEMFFIRTCSFVFLTTMNRNFSISDCVPHELSHREKPRTYSNANFIAIFINNKHKQTAFGARTWMNILVQSINKQKYSISTNSENVIIFIR